MLNYEFAPRSKAPAWERIVEAPASGLEPEVPAGIPNRRLGTVLWN